MAKKLFFLLCPLLFICYRCPIKEGSIIEIPCKVVDMQGNPLKGVTLSLVSSDSLFLTANPRVEQQKTTDSKGELTFVYEHSRLLFRFIRGENQGNLAAIELFDTPTLAGDKADLTFHYDSLVPVKIRFKSTLPLMLNGAVELYMRSNGSNLNSFLLNAKFSIPPTQIDTLFKVNVFSQPEFNINASLKLYDTSKKRDSILWRSVNIPEGGKRDTVFTFSF